MATALQIQQLYVAYFGRPADPAGLDYWVSTGISTKDFAAAMYAQPEFQQANANLPVIEQVNALYLNLFGRSGDTEGLLYWTQQINTGKLTLASIANDLIFAANNNPSAQSQLDKTALNNKTATAITYTADVRETSASLIAYNPTSTTPWVTGPQFTSAVTFLSTVTQTAPTAAAIQASVDAMTAIPVPGQTFTLTTDKFSYVGGTGNDTFIGGLNAAGQQTLLAQDTIVGGGGTNTLIATIINSVTPASISNIQNVDLTFQGAIAVVNLSNATGITTLTNNGSSANASVSGLSTSTAVVSQNTATNFDLAFAGVSGTSDSAALTLSGVNGGTTTINGIETLTLLSSGSTTNTLQTLTGAQLVTLNVGGSAGLTITGALAAVTTVAQPVGGSLSGALNLTFAQGVVTATGGAGNDTFRVQAAGAASLNGGAGNETFIFDNGTFTNTDSVVGGDGTNILRVSAADAAAYVAPATATVSGIQTLSIGDVLGANLNASNIASSINTVNLRAGTNAAVTLTGNAGTFNATLGDTGSNGVLGGALTINDVGVATTDVLNLSNANAAAAQNAYGNQALALNGYETVNLSTGTTTVPGAQQSAAINIQADGTAASVLNISGANNLTVTGAITAGSIDAAGLTGTAALLMDAVSVGTTTISGGGGADRLRGAATATLIDGRAGNDSIFGGAANDTLRGGDGNDVIDATQAGNDSIDGGAGDDRILLGATLTADDSVDGGTGTNTAVITAAVATAAIGARLSNIQTLETAAAAQDMSVFTGTTITTIAESGAALAVTNAGATLNTFNVVDDAPNVINSSFRRATDTSTNALTINAGGTIGATSALAINDEETITLNTSTFAVDLDLTNAGDLTSLTITGSGNTATAIDVSAIGAANLANVSFSGINSTRAVAVDASASTVALTLTGGDFAGTYTTGSGADSVTGGALADVITTGNGADTVNSGGGNDNVSTGSGNDIINLGTGQDTVDAGAGADAITLTVDGATDQIRQAATTSVVATATSFENATVAVGDSLTFGNGVDVVNNFLAGASAGADQLQVLVGGALPTTLIGQVVADLSAGNAVFFASGSFNASTGRFTIAANGSGADTMIIQSTGAGASDNLNTNASGVVLVGVKSSDLVAGNFGGAATAYVVSQPSLVSSATGAITGGAVSAQNLLNLGFTSISGGVIGDANTLTINGEGGAQTFNSVTGVFTGATNAAVNQLLYQAVDTVNLDAGNDAYTTASIAAGTTTVNAGTGVDTLAFTAASNTAAVNLGTSTVVVGFENIDASLNTVALNATLVADSTSYFTSAHGDTVTFANAAGNAVAVIAAANTEPRTLTFAGGDATDVVTADGVRFDIAAGALASDLVVNAIDAADNAFTITTGTNNTTVNNGVAGDVITVAAAAAADGRLISIGGASQYTVTGLNADLTSAATAAVAVTSASTTAQTLTNTGTGLVTANVATIADNAVLTVAGAGAGGFALNNVSADVLSTAAGAVAVSSAAVANQTVTNNSAAGAITINALNLADNAALTVAGTNAGGATVNNLIADITSTAGGLVTANLADVTNLSATNTGAGALTVNAAALADGRVLTTAGTSQLTVTGLLADLTNTNTSGNVTATLRSGVVGAEGVTVTSTTAINVLNGTFGTVDTLTLAGEGIKTVGSVADGFAGIVSFAASNVTDGSVVRVGAASNTVNQAAGAGSFTVDANLLGEGPAAVLTIGGGGTAGKTVTITGLKGDATLAGNVSFANVTTGNAVDNTVAITTGTANSTITGGGADDVVTVTSNVADESLLTLAGVSQITANTVIADVLKTATAAVTVNTGAVATLTATNNAAGQLTIVSTLADNTALTVAGTNAGNTVINNLSADLTSTATGGTVTANLANVANINVTNTGTAQTIVDATVLADNQQLTTAGTGQLTINALLADLTNTNTSGNVTATLRGTLGGDAVTVTSTTAINVLNGNFAAADTLTLAGAGIKTVGTAVAGQGFVAAVVLDGTNIGNGSVITIGAAANTVTQNAGAGSFTVNATNLANNTAITVNGAGTGASTVTINNLVGDATLAGNGSSAVVNLLDNGNDDNIAIVTGTGNTTVAGAAATDTITVTSNVVAGSTVTLTGSAAGAGTINVNTLVANVTNQGGQDVTANAAAGGLAMTATNIGTGLLTFADNVGRDGRVTTLAGNTAITVDAAASDITNTNTSAGLNDINVTTQDVGTQTFTNNAAGSTLNVNALATADGQAFTVTGAGATRFTNLQADVTSTAGGAVTIVSTNAANVSLTNNGAGLITAALGNVNAAGTLLAGNGAGGFTITGLDQSLDRTYTGAGAVNITIADAALTIDNNAAAAAITVNAGALSDGRLLTIQDTAAAGQATVTALGLGDLTFNAYSGTSNVTTGAGQVGIGQVVNGSAGAMTFAGGASASNFAVNGGIANDTITSGAGNDTINGGGGNDEINAGGAADTIQGAAGNDVLTGGAAADRFVFQTTQALNGTDQITDFSLAEVDNITFDFGDGGLANQAALRGDGSGAQRLAAGAALGANTGFVISSANIADAAAADLYAEGLTGENANDIIYLLGSQNAAGAGLTTLYSVTYNAPNDATITTLGTFGVQTIANWGANQITQFAL